MGSAPAPLAWGRTHQWASRRGIPFSLPGTKPFRPRLRARRVPLWGPGAPKALSPNPFGGVTRLTNARIAHLVRQAQIEWDGDSLPQMAARWGVTRRRLRQILQSWRTSGVVPRLNPARRPRAPPIPEEVRRFLLAEWQRVHRGPSYLWRASQRHGYSVSHRQVTAFARLQGLSRPNARKQRKRKRGRYERAHSGSLLHGDFHRTSEPTPTASSGWTMPVG